MQHRPEAILAAAISVFLSEGVSASTAKIAATAGVSNGTLFNYFPTKRALLDALYLSIKTDLATALGVFDPGQRLELRMRQVWDRWFGWATDNPDAHRVVNLLHQADLASPDAQAAGKVLIQEATQVLHEAQGSGILVELPIEHIAALFQHNLDQAIASALDEQEAERAYYVLRNGITQDLPATRAMECT